MAWQNLLRYKRRFFFTIVSLFLGFVTALGSVVLAAGTDQTHAIEKKPDFKIGGNYIELNYYREFSPVRESVKEKLLSVDGIQKDTVKVQRGDFLVVDNQEEAFRPLLDAYRSDEEEMLSDETKGEPPILPDTATIQIAEDSYIEQLEAYVAEKSLKADIQALREGTGVLLLHHHELSPTLLEEADKRIGFPVSFWKIPIKTEEEWKERKEKSFSEFWTEPAQNYEKAGELKLAGYLDTQAKGFPELDMTWHGEGIKYFLISETGFQKLLASEKTFGIQYHVDRQKEPSINITIRQILQEENRREPGQEDDLYVHCKSDELESAQGYIKTNRIIMGALSGVLLLMGIANYLNVIVTGMAARKREFAVMESVGMTGRQMKGMLIAEGTFYGGILTLLVFTAGTGILQLLHRYMDSRIAYFKFAYPWGTVLLLLAVLLGICLGVPVLFYKKTDMADIHTL